MKKVSAKQIVKEQEKKRAVETLQKYRGKKVYAIVNSVSRSGMSRRIEYYVVHEDEIVRIGYLIARITENSYDINKGGLLVGGCGMDMIFSVLSNFNYAMAKIDTGKTLTELLESKKCGERIYDKYFFDANNYGCL